MPFYQALEDPDTRAEYIRREYLGDCTGSGLTVIADLQRLQWWTEAFVSTITQSAQRMPYSMRFMARETLAALRVGGCLVYKGPGLIHFVQERFPDTPPELYAGCIARIVYYRFINPAIL